MKLSVLIITLSILASFGSWALQSLSSGRGIDTLDTGSHIAFRFALSTLLALLCPALVLAGHGGLPVPTVTGLKMVLVQLSSISDFEVALIGVGDSEVVVLILPAMIAFSFARFALCTKFRNSNPRLPVWDE